MGFLSRFFRKPTEQSFATCLRVIQVGGNGSWHHFPPPFPPDTICPPTCSTARLNPSIWYIRHRYRDLFVSSFG